MPLMYDLASEAGFLYLFCTLYEYCLVDWVTYLPGDSLCMTFSSVKETV